MNELSKDSVNWLAVGEEGTGQRIDHFLCRILKGVPKSHVYRILRSGEVRLNGRRVGPGARLAEGDELRVPPIRVASRSGDGRPPGPSRAVQELAILFEDDVLLIVDKPAGLAVHGGSGIVHGLIEQLRAARPHARFLELAHRIDRETSGVLVIAKQRAALVELHRMLREGEVDKRYLALVRGKWRDEKRTVQLSLHTFATSEGVRRVRVVAEGRYTQTIFRRQRVWPDRNPPLALLEAQLKTGRTHQIRVHLAHIGFPLAGDDKYGDFEWNRELARQGLNRMFLHAHILAFAHPVTRAGIRVKAALPPELVGFVGRIDAGG